MVARILEQEEAIRRVLSTDRKTASLNLTWQDKDVLQSMNQVLSKLSELTDILSGENYVTVSSVLPMVELLNNSLLKQCEDDTDLVASMKKIVQDDINSRYTDSEIVTLLRLASLLDPRFKSKYLEESSLEVVKDTIISEISALRSLQEQPSLPFPNPEEPAKKRKTTLASFFKDNEVEQEDETRPLLSPEQKVQKELGTYLSTPRIDMEVEPLAWWRHNCNVFPLLSTLAKKYLSVCATSSPSERLFSSSGHIVNSLRGNLNPEKVNMLVFLNNNL